MDRRLDVSCLSCGTPRLDGRKRRLTEAAGPEAAFQAGQAAPGQPPRANPARVRGSHGSRKRGGPTSVRVAPAFLESAPGTCSLAIGWMRLEPSDLIKNGCIQPNKSEEVFRAAKIGYALDLTAIEADHSHVFRKYNEPAPPVLWGIHTVFVQVHRMFELIYPLLFEDWAGRR